MLSLNFQKIINRYKKLHCPEDTFNPCKLPYDRNKYFVLCSERSVGKTTNVLLFGMCAHEEHGTQIQYIRQLDQMLEPKRARQLFDTILKFDYVRKVTRGRWNSVEYYARGWTYTKVEDGKIVEKDSKPFMYCLGLNQNDFFRSTYNAPDGDIIIMDEFVSNYNPQNEFVTLCDMIKTIIRERTSPIIFLLGNTLDRYHSYFEEMELLPITTTMPLGQHAETITSKGTPIYIEFVTREKTPEKLHLNKIFFGFQNKRLGSITGEDWAIVPYQHIDKTDDPEVYVKSFYIQIEDYLINLEVARSDKYGIHVLAHFANKTYADSHIYSLNEMHDYRYRYRFGHDKADRLIWTLYERKKFFYSSNSVGALVEKYVSQCSHNKSQY